MIPSGACSFSSIPPTWSYQKICFLQNSPSTQLTLLPSSNQPNNPSPFTCNCPIRETFRYASIYSPLPRSQQHPSFLHLASPSLLHPNRLCRPIFSVSKISLPPSSSPSIPVHSPFTFQLLSLQKPVHTPFQNKQTPCLRKPESTPVQENGAPST